MESFLRWMELREAVVAPSAEKVPPAFASAPNANPTQAAVQTPLGADPQPSVSKKVIVYPDFQGVDDPDDVNNGGHMSLSVADCIGNEPGKDFNYFKNGHDNDKGPIKDYVENIVRAAREKGAGSFPPVKAIKHPLLPGKYLVIDGNHRLGAFRIGGITDIKAMVLGEQDIVLAAPGTRWQQGVVPQTMTLDQARKGNVDLKNYFSTRELVVPQNDEWVVSLRIPAQQQASPVLTKTDRQP